MIDLDVLIREARLVKDYDLETTQKMLEDRYSVEQVAEAWTNLEIEQSL